MKGFQKIHGMSETPTYHTWEKIKSRCLNPHNPDFKYYGGRQPNPVTICSEWRDSFEVFFQQMGEKPYGATIDRISNELGYCKENCKWSSRREQALNRSSTTLLIHKGIALPFTVWAEKYNIKPATLRARLKRGYSVDEALTKPVKESGKKTLQKKAA